MYLRSQSRIDSQKPMRDTKAKKRSTEVKKKKTDLFPSQIRNKRRNAPLRNEKEENSRCQLEVSLFVASDLQKFNRMVKSENRRRKSEFRKSRNPHGRADEPDLQLTLFGDSRTEQQPSKSEPTTSIWEISYKYI